MVVTNPILSNVSAGISELKKNPMSVVEQGDGSPVAILNRNKPVFYAVPANVYEDMLDTIEDIELATLVESRKNQDEVVVSIEQLTNEL